MIEKDEADAMVIQKYAVGIATIVLDLAQRELNDGRDLREVLAISICAAIEMVGEGVDDTALGTKELRDLLRERIAAVEARPTHQSKSDEV